MLGRLSEGGADSAVNEKVITTCWKGMGVNDGWGVAATGVLEDLLKTIGPEVSILTREGNGTYKVDMMTVSNPARRTRSANVPSKSCAGDLCQIQSICSVVGTAVLSVLIYDEMFKETHSEQVHLGTQTCIRIRWYAGEPYEIYGPSELLTEVMPRLSGLVRWKDPRPSGPAPLFMGIGAGTIKNGAIPPSVAVPVEPKEPVKRKWWKK